MQTQPVPRSDMLNAVAASFTHAERNEFRLARWRRRYRAWLRAEAKGQTIRFPLELVRVA